MIKNWLYFFGSIALAITCTQVKAQDITYNLRGRVGLYSAPAKAYLMYMNGEDRRVDSVVITSGTFAFTGKSDRPKIASLFINTKGSGFTAYDAGFINLYLEDGTILVTSGDSLQNTKVTGGQLNKDYDALKIALKRTDAKLDSVNHIFFTASPEKQQSAGFRESIINASFRVEDEQKSVCLEFLKNNPSSLVSLSALEDYAGLYPDSRLVEPVFNLLSANVRSSKAGLSYAAKIARMKKTAIGAVAPDFTLVDTLGKPVSLHDFKGKYVLIDFWASWCEPCRAENPNLIASYNLYQQKNFTVLGISLDVTKARDQWLKAIHDDHLPWTQLADLNRGPKNEASALYNIDNIPQNVLVGPDGKIIDKNLRGNDLFIRLKKLLDQ